MNEDFFSERLKSFSKVIQEKIKSSNRIILFQHKHPDLDSLGSNIGFLNYIFHFKNNAEVYIVSTDEPSRNIFNKVKATFPEHFIVQDPSTFDYQKDDLLFFIDFADISRATKISEMQLPEHLDICVIDHHIVESKYKNSYIEPKNQSASSIIYELIKSEKIEFKKEYFEFIIMGILGDSGFLRYRDQKFSQTLSVINEFCKLFGIDSYYNIIEYLETNRPIEEYNLQKIYLNNLVIENGFAYTTITNQERKDAGVSHEFSETTNGAVLIRNIEGTKFVFSVTQDLSIPNKYNLSFRTCSGSNFIVRDLAAKLNGGGHPVAAGAWVLADSIEIAIQKVKTAIHEFDGF